MKRNVQTAAFIGCVLEKKTEKLRPNFRLMGINNM